MTVLFGDLLGDLISDEILAMSALKIIFMRYFMIFIKFYERDLRFYFTLSKPKIVVEYKPSLSKFAFQNLQI